jgi:hypothetical protein
VALLALLVIGVATRTGVAVVGGVLLGAALTASIAAVNVDQSLRPLIGGPILLGATAGTVGVPAYLAATGAPVSAGMLLAGVTVGMGVTRFRVETIGNGAVSRAIAWVLRVGFVTAGLTLLVIILGLNVSHLTSTIGAFSTLTVLVTPSTETTAPLGFFVAAWLAFGGVWLASITLPPAAVLPPSKRVTYGRVRAHVTTVTGILFGGVGTILTVVYLLAIQAGIAGTLIESTIGPVIWSVTLRTLLLQIFLIGVVLTVLLLFFQSVGAALAYRRPAWMLSGGVIAVGGLLITAVGTGPALEMLSAAGVTPPVIDDTVIPLIGRTATGMVGLTIGLTGIAAVLTALPVLSRLGLLPSATVAPRLVVTGLLTGTIVGAADEATALALFIGVIAAIIVWDVSEFGAGQLTDVGPAPTHREGEFVHAGASLLVGVTGLIGTFILYLFATRIEGSTDGVLVVVLVGAVVTTAATVLLRG